LCRDALVSEGAVVEKGAVIGLLQVGVLLIPVVAPCDGRVVGHLVAEGAIAGYGTRLVALTAGAAS
jgi:acetyl-CoA carboxylase biotin carboxyl carrier protein